MWTNVLRKWSLRSHSCNSIPAIPPSEKRTRTHCEASRGTSSDNGHTDSYNMYITCPSHAHHMYGPVFLHVLPRPHPGPPLDVLLHHCTDGEPPPALPVLTQGHLGLVLEVLPVDGHAVQRLQQTHDVLILRQQQQHINFAMLNALPLSLFYPGPLSPFSKLIPPCPQPLV